MSSSFGPDRSLPVRSGRPELDLSRLRYRAGAAYSQVAYIHYLLGEYTAAATRRRGLVQRDQEIGDACKGGATTSQLAAGEDLAEKDPKNDGQRPALHYR